ncbi:helix-turn-helix domain-containing protein [Chamaesiphon polymorphus]|uniref:Transcriptional regulator n=1 Tax=Chamaesiphon polymorphus CCALA 037 TaxID=2107692 RepID=A0A2T1GLQ8_9CYAN|nr:transcriptional regulator [Chamaesiphon polymorphus]PSB58765.1 transcriptional regulator [Chamaesiphon polymorphus CCALA 037]
MTPATLPKLDPAAIREQLSLSQEKLSSLLKVSTKTVNRAEKQHLPLKDTDVRARLAKLQEIASLGLMVYSNDGLSEFLNTPLPVFNGYTAIDLMSIGEYDRVIGALAADFEGLGY